MQTIQISEFKAKCLRILDRVARTGESLLITKRGKPIARVLPVPPEDSGRWLGSLEGTAKEVGDLVVPAVDPDEWEAIRK
jgi:prevent-host-death family protein